MNYDKYYKMEHLEIFRLLNDSTVLRKSIKVNDLSNGQYSVDKNIRLKTPMLRLDLCDYSDAYIVLKRAIVVSGTNVNNWTNKELAFKNNAPFNSCILKINDTFIDNAGNLNIVMLMYNLVKYGNNCSMTSGS